MTSLPAPSRPLARASRALALAPVLALAAAGCGGPKAPTTIQVGVAGPMTGDQAKQGKDWFGAAPPDLSLVARSRASGSGSGADYLYTYMRTFYRDDTKATGWNNLVFPSVAMPHVLWELQGQQRAVFVERPDPHDAKKTIRAFDRFETITPGALTKVEYDAAVADLVAYLQWMGEPAQNQRVRIGVWVLLFLGLFTLITWRLNAAFWKDVK